MSARGRALPARLVLALASAAGAAGAVIGRRSRLGGAALSALAAAGVWDDITGGAHHVRRLLPRRGQGGAIESSQNVLRSQALRGQAILAARGVGQQPVDGRDDRVDVSGRHEQAADTVFDEVLGTFASAGDDRRALR